MQIRKIKTVTPENDFEKALEEELLSFSSLLQSMLNKGLKVADNLYAQIATVSNTGNADTEFTASHDLKGVPIGFIVINIDKAGVVYDSGTDWTSTAIYLKCNVANCNVKLIILGG